LQQHYKDFIKLWSTREKWSWHICEKTEIVLGTEQAFKSMVMKIKCQENREW
jgi:hypothetical protein